MNLLKGIVVISFYAAVLGGTAYLIYWKDASSWLWLLAFAELGSVKLSSDSDD